VRGAGDVEGVALQESVVCIGEEGMKGPYVRYLRVCALHVCEAVLRCCGAYFVHCVVRSDVLGIIDCCELTTLVDHIVAAAFLGQIVARFEVNVFGDSLQTVCVIESVLWVERCFDLGVNAAVCDTECIEVEVLCVDAVESAVFDLLVLRLEVGHYAWAPMTTVLIMVSEIAHREGNKHTEFVQTLTRSFDVLCSGKSCSQI